MYYNWKEKTDTEELKVVCNLIRNGELVIFPTETVYGIGANALDPIAVGKIFLAKGRQSDNPLIVHLADRRKIQDIVEDVTEMEQKLIDAFMPGPFTLILKRKPIIPDIVTAGLDTVAIRIPDNIIAKGIITFSGCPIAAPSANISGRPSGTSVEDIYGELADKVDCIVDGGRTNIGVESTVVRVIDDVVHILRPGKITYEQITEVAGTTVVDKHVLGKLEDGTKPPSPGMKYKHYAPNTKCVLVYNKDNNVTRTKLGTLIDSCLKSGEKPLLMCLSDNAKFFKDKNITIIDMGNSLDEISKNIFTDLRKADTFNADLIIIQGVSTEGLGLAIMNRLLRACNYNIITSGD